MFFSRLVQLIPMAGLLALGSLTVSADMISAGQCVGGLCTGTLDIFSNTPGTLLDSNSTSFTAYDNRGDALYSGTLRAAVYRNASNTLDFYFQFVNNWYSEDSVGRLTMTNFAGFTTDVGYRSDNWDGGGIFRAGTQGPVGADRSASGGTVGFTFGSGWGQINPGETSSTMVIRTNAVNYTLGSVTTQNGAVYTASAFSPDGGAGVPEPSTYAMIGAGLAAVGMLRRRK